MSRYRKILSWQFIDERNQFYTFIILQRCLTWLFFKIIRQFSVSLPPYSDHMFAVGRARGIQKDLPTVPFPIILPPQTLTELKKNFSPLLAFPYNMILPIRHSFKSQQQWQKRKCKSSFRTNYIFPMERQLAFGWLFFQMIKIENKDM